MDSPQTNNDPIIEKWDRCYQKVKYLTSSSPFLDIEIAEMLGWTKITYRSVVCKYRGLPPGITGSAEEDVPTFTRTTEGAVRCFPEHWVESYYRCFDGICIAKGTPSDILGRRSVINNEGGSSPALALLAVAILAQIQMLTPMEPETETKTTIITSEGSSIYYLSDLHPYPGPTFDNFFTEPTPKKKTWWQKLLSRPEPNPDDEENGNYVA